MPGQSQSTELRPAPTMPDSEGSGEELDLDSIENMDGCDEIVPMPPWHPHNDSYVMVAQRDEEKNPERKTGFQRVSVAKEKQTAVDKEARLFAGDSAGKSADNHGLQENEPKAETKDTLREESARNTTRSIEKKRRVYRKHKVQDKVARSPSAKGRKRKRAEESTLNERDSVRAERDIMNEVETILKSPTKRRRIQTVRNAAVCEPQGTQMPAPATAPAVKRGVLEPISGPLDVSNERINDAETQGSTWQTSAIKDVLLIPPHEEKTQKDMSGIRVADPGKKTGGRGKGKTQQTSFGSPASVKREKATSPKRAKKTKTSRVDVETGNESGGGAKKSSHVGSKHPQDMAGPTPARKGTNKQRAKSSARKNQPSIVNDMHTKEQIGRVSLSGQRETSAKRKNTTQRAVIWSEVSRGKDSSSREVSSENKYTANQQQAIQTRPTLGASNQASTSFPNRKMIALEESGSADNELETRGPHPSQPTGAERIAKPTGLKRTSEDENKKAKQRPSDPKDTQRVKALAGDAGKAKGRKEPNSKRSVSRKESSATRMDPLEQRRTSPSCGGGVQSEPDRKASATKKGKRQGKGQLKAPVMGKDVGTQVQKASKQWGQVKPARAAEITSNKSRTQALGRRASQKEKFTTKKMDRTTMKEIPLTSPLQLKGSTERTHVSRSTSKRPRRKEVATPAKDALSMEDLNVEKEQGNRLASSPAADPNDSTPTNVDSKTGMEKASVNRLAQAVPVSTQREEVAGARAADTNATNAPSDVNLAKRQQGQASEALPSARTGPTDRDALAVGSGAPARLSHEDDGITAGSELQATGIQERNDPEGPHFRTPEAMKSFATATNLTSSAHLGDVVTVNKKIGARTADDARTGEVVNSQTLASDTRQLERTVWMLIDSYHRKARDRFLKSIDDSLHNFRNDMELLTIRVKKDIGRVLFSSNRSTSRNAGAEEEVGEQEPDSGSKRTHSMKGQSERQAPRRSKKRPGSQSSQHSDPLLMSAGDSSHKQQEVSRARHLSSGPAEKRSPHVRDRQQHVLGLFSEQNKEVTSKLIASRFHLTDRYARRVLKRMQDGGLIRELEKRGKGGGRRYVLNSSFPDAARGKQSRMEPSEGSEARERILQFQKLTQVTRKQ